MDIQRDDLIKHRKSMDVCFQVVSVYKGSKAFKLKGYWMNQGRIESWLLLSKHSYIEIQYENMKDILFATEIEDNTCFRYCGWVFYGDRRG